MSARDAANHEKAALAALLGALLLSLACRGPKTPEVAPETFGDTWHGEFAPRSASFPERLKLFDWNIERGLQFEAVREAIAVEDPAVCILQEVDLRARRTRGADVAEELARANGYNYVFGIEFQELGQGTPTTPAYQGQATLSRLPIRAHRVLRFLHQSRFWSPRRFIPNLAVFQRRLGGRMALVTEIAWGERPLVIYNVHLESRMAANGRVRQLQEVLEDAKAYPPETAIVLAGDFNARTHPQRLLERLEREGFRAAIGTREPTTQSEESTVSSFGEAALSFATGAEARGNHLSIDWVFVRGPLEFARGRVHSDVKASDHYPVSVEISPVATEP